jgi:hypothetical protein
MSEDPKKGRLPYNRPFLLIFLNFQVPPQVLAFRLD